MSVAPPPQDEYPVSEETMAPPEEIAAFTPVNEYIDGYLLGGLGDNEAAAGLSEQLQALTAALASGDVQAAARAIDTADQLLSEYGDAAARVEDGAILGVIELTLIRAADLIGWHEYE